MIQTICASDHRGNSSGRRYFGCIAAVCALIFILASCTGSDVVGVARSKVVSGPDYELLVEQGTALSRERFHKRAILVFDQAGRLFPDRVEWQYEKAAAQFAMDQFKAAALTAGLLIDRAPAYDAAYSLWWMARLADGKKNAALKETIRQEARNLLDTSRRRPEALFAVYIAYEFMGDRARQQDILLELARSLPPDDPDLQESVARSLFEEIIIEKKEPATKMRLIESYLEHFPHRRFAGYVARQYLSEKQRLADSAIDPLEEISRFNPPEVNSRQIRTGVARWLIEQNRLPEAALDLLEDNHATARPEERPDGFSDALWQAELQHQQAQRDYLMGRAWFALEQFDLARAALSRAAAEDPLLGEAYDYLGQIAEIQKDTIGAVAFYRRALETGSPDADPLPRLRSLMKSQYTFDGDPARYFASAQHQISFSDVTETAGLFGRSAQHAAWGDYNLDGRPDLLLDGHLLFCNRGRGHFEEVTDAAGLSEFAASDGGIFGDYDNDGDLDLFVYSRNENHLLNNQGGAFTEVQHGLFGAEKRTTAAAAWGDLNNDGFIDLYVVNYENFSIMRGTGIPDQLYLNDGSGGFSDISDRAGIITDEAMCGRGATWTDYNQDGYLDIVVANYRLDPNFLWMNRGDLTLVDRSEKAGVRGYMKKGYFGHSIGPVSGDLDNDTDPDLFITNLAHPRYIEISDQNMLLINGGAPGYSFADIYVDSGISFEETNADPALADVDNDGDLDLYITSIYSGRNAHLYVNQPGGRFEDITWVSGTRVENAWGCAFADFDGDGFIDLLVTGEKGVHLLKNNGNGNHWLKVGIRDSGCNRFGIGGRLTLTLPGASQVREIAAGRGAGNQDDSTLCFGLGGYCGPGQIEYRSLCGQVITRTFDRPDQMLIIGQ